MLKEILDRVLALVLCAVLLPLFLLIALLIACTSKGPILFRQRRIGQNKEEFYIYKFRTMYIDTPKDVATHLLENPEKYITPIGKLLRKTSLDELPQLFNILRGDMSFVGPRPALYNQYDLIELREKNGVNKIKPGLTGWAQINGRDELSIEKKVEFDTWYVNNQSLWLDMKIIFRTLFSVVSAKGVVEGKQ